MAEELRIAFMLLGSLAIGAVVLHGIWTVRKTVGEEKLKAKQQEAEQTPEPSFEEKEIANLKLQQMEIDFAEIEVQDKDNQGLPVASVNLDSIYDEKASSEDLTDEQIEASDGSEVNPNQSDFLTEAENEQEVSAQVEIEETDAALAEQEPTVAQIEPEFSGFSALDDEDVEPSQVLESESVTTSVEPESSTGSASAAEPVKEDVLILFIDKSEGEPIDGPKLLPLLLTLGFKFGEMEFFHRHESNSGQGDVLFSLANMYNPGTFDIDNMEQMQTRGLSIFMTLPNAGEPLQTFNMMHNAAKKIADEFGAKVLDQHRNPIDVSIVRGYVERIRKF